LGLISLFVGSIQKGQVIFLLYFEKEFSMYEYMILTQKDRVFGGKFNPEMIQTALNNLASEGWRVIEAATTTFPGMLGAREELVFVLERQK
jgi:hypothetical protein